MMYRGKGLKSRKVVKVKGERCREEERERRREEEKRKLG
jgi:hypothetical protein